MENRKNLTRVKEVLNPTSNLFQAINYDFGTFSVTQQMLNVVWSSRYSERWAAPLLELFIETDSEGNKSLVDIELLGRYLKELYQHKWDKLVEVAILEYDPIHNFSDTLVEDIDDTDNETRTDDLTRTVAENRTDNLTETRNLANTQNTENRIYGFDSNTATDSDETDVSGTNSGTVSNTGTVAKNDTVHNTGTQDTDKTYTRDRRVTRIGNIGNLSTQNLLNQEIALWQWNVIDAILADVASELTLPIY